MDYLSDFGSVYESNSNPNSNPNPNPQAWYIRTITRVFELAGGLVQDQVASNLMVLIAEGSEDEELDAEMRAESVAHMVELLVTETDPKTEDVESAGGGEDLLGDDGGGSSGDSPAMMNPNLVAGLPPVLLQIVAWVLGEYGALVAGRTWRRCVPCRRSWSASASRSGRRSSWTTRRAPTS